MVSGCLLENGITWLPWLCLGRDRRGILAVRQDQFDPNRRRVADDVQHRCVALDCNPEPFDLIDIRRRGNLDGGLKIAEAGADPVGRGIETAQIHGGLQFHLHHVQRNAQRLGIEAVGLLVALCQRLQHAQRREQIGVVGFGTSAAAGMQGGLALVWVVGQPVLLLRDAGVSDVGHRTGPPVARMGGAEGFRLQRFSIGDAVQAAPQIPRAPGQGAKTKKPPQRQSWAARPRFSCTCNAPSKLRLKSAQAVCRRSGVRLSSDALDAGTILPQEAANNSRWRQFLFTDVLFEVADGVGKATLNRPQQINALTLDMIRALDDKLAEWAVDKSIRAVMIHGAGDKAFCAGGDIRALYDAKKNGNGKLLSEFFWHEYRLDYRIATYPKQLIAVMDGLTMGGGAGIGLNAPVRVASERVVFSMPECAIGLYPDIGAAHFLQRCPGELGMFLALTEIGRAHV